MLDAGQLALFERDGIVRLPGVFSRDDAARMQGVLWRELERRHGIVRGDRSTWDRHEPTGLVSTKRSRAFEPIGGPPVVEALDQLFGTGGWVPNRHYGNVLVTMPNADAWRVPHRIWHSDFEASAPTSRLFAVKLWALCDEVRPGGGGTPQLAGSHRLFRRYLDGGGPREYKAAKHGFLRSHPWLRQLTRDDGSPDRNERLLDVEVDVDGLPARVVELTGPPGDVFITHAWVFHTIAPNARPTPRFMRSVAVREAPLPS